MKKLFNQNGVFGNYIPGENGTVSILLYGNVGEKEKSDPEEVVTKLMELSNRYKSIDVHINSNGGDVFSGFAIFNALKNCKADISIYVDGIAASIAGVIALCGKPLYMNKNSRLMLHSVSGGTYGNTHEMMKMIELMKSLENSLAEMIAKRCGITEDEVKTRFFDGKDHWFTANEALQQGLINGICEPWEELGEMEITNKSPQEIYTMCYNRFDPESSRPDFLSRVKKNPVFASMNEDEIINYLSTKVYVENTEVILKNAFNKGLISDMELKGLSMTYKGKDLKPLKELISERESLFQSKFDNMYQEAVKTS